MNSRTINAHLAAEHRKKNRDPERIAELRGLLRAEQLAEHIRRVVDQAPPLTDEQRGRLALLLGAAQPAKQSEAA